MNRERICEISQAAWQRLKLKHIGCFEGTKEPLLLISEQYPGLWMEHIYDSVLLATMDKSFLYLAENAVNAFIHRQTEEGQLPFAIWDGNRISEKKTQALYWQIQECVSFYTLCLEIYQMNKDKAFLEKAYASGQGWIAWLRKNRMTTGRGLIELFCGYDTGHDNSARLTGISCPNNYRKDGVCQNASVPPPDDGITPILAVDMNCNFYADEIALAKMAALLGKEEEAAAHQQQAAHIKRLLFSYCYNEEDGFFYDVDRQGKQRKYRSCTLFHLFLERVLHPQEDRALIDRLYREHIHNPEEFWTAYPFPSMALNDPSCSDHPTFNCWGYYTQSLTALRAIRWMDAYGWSEDLDTLCRRFLEAWTRCYDRVPLAQELDPLTGEPTQSSHWYSSCMLFYLYAARRLGLWEEKKSQ